MMSMSLLRNQHIRNWSHPFPQFSTKIYQHPTRDFSPLRSGAEVVEICNFENQDDGCWPRGCQLSAEVLKSSVAQIAGAGVPSHGVAHTAPGHDCKRRIPRFCNVRKKPFNVMVYQQAMNCKQRGQKKESNFTWWQLGVSTRKCQRDKNRY